MNSCHVPTKLSIQHDAKNGKEKKENKIALYLLFFFFFSERQFFFWFKVYFPSLNFYSKSLDFVGSTGPRACFWVWKLKLKLNFFPSKNVAKFRNQVGKLLYNFYSALK